MAAIRPETDHATVSTIEAPSNTAAKTCVSLTRDGNAVDPDPFSAPC
jgi:hypothetical protein